LDRSREWGKLTKGISAPEIVCGATAHPALAKACFYFSIKLIVTDVDPVTQRMDLAAVKVSPRLIGLVTNRDHRGQTFAARAQAATNANTVAIYTSAPNFPNGMVDPIPELGQVSKPPSLPRRWANSSLF
jgi:sphinganine-1-phosphate aldolase